MAFFFSYEMYASLSQATRGQSSKLGGIAAQSIRTPKMLRYRAYIYCFRHGTMEINA
jgi:hypothetical protein